MPEEALTLFTVSDAYCYCVGQAELLRSESRSRIEYLIATDNIIVLDSYFNEHLYFTKHGSTTYMKRRKRLN